MLPAVVGLLVGALVGAGALALLRRSGQRDRGLTTEELERLRRAELSLAAAGSPAVAARELGKHAMALLEAPAAMVLLEGIGDTVRVEVGDTRGHSPYGPGSSARLLQDDGAPVGTVAVAPPADHPFTARDERVLDALGERFSSTLHRLSLFEAVEAEQRALADVLASSSDGIFSTGSDGRVRSWNPAMERLTGVAAVIAVGQSCCASFRPSDEAGTPLHGSACPCRSGDQVEVLAQLVVDAGPPSWLSCAYSPLSDGGCVVVVRDVTARKRIDDEKADFLATVSHELRTPLTPIKGFLQTLLARGDDLDGDTRRHIFEVMLREEQRLERLVQQLLQATSIDHAESTIVLSPTDWATIVAAEVDAARSLDPAREIVQLVEPSLPPVLADAEMGALVVSNLLSNALKYSPAGSPIGVAVASDGERIVTTVADHGPGVAAADRERIFDRFTRLGDHLTRPQQGVGLGLYIVRRCVEMMDGTVWVDEVDGGGAAFSFSLPVAKAGRRRRRATPLELTPR